MTIRNIGTYQHFLDDLKQRVATARYQAARTLNTELILLYHHVGKEILKSQQQHGWGAKDIDQLSHDLHAAFPEMKGFSPRNLKYMRKFAQEYPESEFVQEVLAQLSWYHHFFNIKKALEHGWSRSVMAYQIESRLHERQGKAITNFKEKLPQFQSDLAHGILKDSYLFDFLSINIS